MRVAVIWSVVQAIAGDGKDIVDQMIYLRVEGPECPDLTLIDLPGEHRHAPSAGPNPVA